MLLRECGNDVIRRQWPPDPFQLELTDRLDLYGVLDRRQNPRIDEYLSRLRLVTKSRSYVRHSSDSRIIEAPLKPDGAKRGKAMRDPNAEANVVPKPTPFIRQ